MGNAFQTTKNLIIRKPKILFYLVVLFLIIIISQTTSAYTANWWPKTQAVTGTVKDNVYNNLMNATQRGYVDSGHDYIVWERNNTCYILVAESDTTEINVTFDYTSENRVNTNSTGNFNYIHYNNSSTSSCTSSSGTVSASGSSNSISSVIMGSMISGKINSITYGQWYENDHSPTVSEINAVIAHGTPSNWDNLLTVSDTPRVSYTYLDNDPYSNVTGHTNDRCHDTNYNQNFNDWYNLFNNYANGMPDGSQKTQALNFVYQIDNAIAGVNGGYGVLHDYSDDGDYHRTVIFTWEDSATVEFVTVSGNNRIRLNSGNNDLRYYTITPSCSIFDTSDTPPSFSIGSQSQPSNGDLFIDNTSTDTFSIGTQSHTPTTRAISLINGDYTVTYPAGYTGELLPDYLPAEPYYSQTWTDFDVFAEGYMIRATYNGNKYDDSKCTYINWRYIFFEDPEDPYNPENVQHSFTKVGDDLELIAPTSGFYRIDATWQWAVLESEFNESGLDISNQAYCQSAVLVGNPDSWISVALDNGDLPMNTGKVFPVDGVSTEIYSYSLNRECFLDEQDFIVTGFYPPSMLCIYETTWTLKDCTVYGIDQLGERISCEFDNFLKQFRVAMIEFFVPHPQRINTIFQKLSYDISQDRSFLTYPLAWIIQTMTLVTTQDENCTTPNATVFSATTSFDLCQAKQDWPQAWTFGITIFRLSFALMFIIACYKVFTGLWSKENDI